MRSTIEVAALAAASLIAAGPAGAGDGQGRPKPACSAVVVDDERGDAENAGLDLVGVFLTEALGDSFANIVVADLDGEVEQADSNQEYFRLRYRDDSDRTQTRWAHVHDSGRRDGATWFDGIDGIVQIRLPSLTPGTPTTLDVETGGQRVVLHREVGGIHEEPFDVEVTPFTTVVDELASGTPSSVCPPKPAAAAPPPPTHGAQPRSPVTAGTPRLRGRALRVPLRSSSPVFDLRGRLSRGGRVVARGKLAELDGRGVLVLTARRAFRPGTYTLSIPGVLERRVRIA